MLRCVTSCCNNNRSLQIPCSQAYNRTRLEHAFSLARKNSNPRNSATTIGNGRRANTEIRKLGLTSVYLRFASVISLTISYPGRNPRQPAISVLAREFLSCSSDFSKIVSSFNNRALFRVFLSRLWVGCKRHRWMKEKNCRRDVAKREENRGIEGKMAPG